MVVAELAAVAFVEDEDDALVAQRGELFGVAGQPAILAAAVAGAGFVQRQAQLLDGADDHLVGGVLGQHAPHQRAGVGVLLHAARLEAVEFLAGLPVQVLAVHHEQAFGDVRVVLEQGGGLEAGQRLAAAGGVPDVAVAEIFVDALDDVLDRVDLVRPHHEQLLLALHQHHVAADHVAQRALGQERIGEGIQAGDLAVVRRGVLVHRQELLLRVEGEVAGVVVGEVVGVVAVADHEQLEEAQQGARVAAAGVGLVLDDLLHRPAWIDAQRLQLDLDDGHAVDQQHHVKAVVAVVGIDAQLAGHLEGVLAPVGDVDQRVVQRGAIVAGEGVAVTQPLRGGENVGGDDFVQQAGKLGIGQGDLVQRLEVLAEIGFQRGAVTDVRAQGVLELAELFDQLLLDGGFADAHVFPVCQLGAVTATGLIPLCPVASRAPALSCAQAVRRATGPTRSGSGR